MNFCGSGVRDFGPAGPSIFYPKTTLQLCAGEVLMTQLKEDGKPNNSGALRDPQPSNWPGGLVHGLPLWLKGYTIQPLAYFDPNVTNLKF